MLLFLAFGYDNRNNCAYCRNRNNDDNDYPPFEAAVAFRGCFRGCRRRIVGGRIIGIICCGIFFIQNKSRIRRNKNFFCSLCFVGSIVILELLRFFKSRVKSLYGFLCVNGKVRCFDLRNDLGQLFAVINCRGCRIFVSVIGICGLDIVRKFAACVSKVCGVVLLGLCGWEF